MSSHELNPPAKYVEMYRKALAGELSPRKAIHCNCIECCGWSFADAAQCDIKHCPLWKYSPAAKRLQNAPEKKQGSKSNE
ncbi:MAG: hypothetical protein AB7F23_10145 [Phycisphaerae bacterium]